MKPMLWAVFPLLGSLLTAPSAMAESTHEHQVRRFVAAFNAQDADAMAMLVTADVEWLSIEGDKVTTDARGREALRKSTREYFKSCPSCRSKLTQLSQSRQRVSAIEVASWSTERGRKEQRSLSVYEFKDGLIRRVYYFPVEP